MYISKKQSVIGGVVALVALAVTLGGFAYFERSASRSQDIEFLAQQIIKACASAPYHPTCYQTEVPKLVKYLPTEKIFDVIRLMRNQDESFLYCHVLAHKLGSYEVSKDPNNWLDVIAKGPTDGMCSNGYAHGALVTRFNDEDLSPEEFKSALPDLAIACEGREGFEPTDLTKAICYHGIGHVLIHMTLAQVEESLVGCDFIGKKDDGRDYRQLCTEGVYMQLFQPLEPEDYALVDMLPFVPTKDNLKKFCTENSQNNTQYGACWREAWPLFGEDIYTEGGMDAYCGVLNDAQDKNLCYISAFTINGRHNLGDSKKMAAVCNSLNDENKGSCFARGANAFGEEDPNLVNQGVAMCEKANTKAAQNECFGFLADVASFNFNADSPAFEMLCTALPVPFQKQSRGE